MNRYNQRLIGEIIKEARERLGLSQRQLAEHITELSNGKRPITREEISRWERHKVIPDADSRYWLSLALQIPIEVLDATAGSAERLR